MFDTNFIFKKGKLTILGDGTFGSSGKAAIASFICEHADYDFACNSFSAQAGHWSRLDNGKSYFYQTFNSCAYQNKYQRLLIGPDAAIELSALKREIEENNIPINKIGIHPLATIIQEKDMAYERGEVDFEGNMFNKLEDGTKKHGSTCHGTGPARVRKMLRRKDTLYAKDVPDLKDMICDVSNEIISRLDAGQTGLLEIAQGFPLSLNYRFHPACTNRNVTVSAALDGMFIPPIYAGNIILNYRTFPIRISSYKYIGDNGKFLTWAEVEEYKIAGKKYEIYKGDSGGWYNDQTEVDWDYITKISESNTKIMELTSVTKLPRRVATFSKECLEDSIKFNRTGHDIYLSINFMNYVDSKISGIRGNGYNKLTDKSKEWLKENVDEIANKYNAKVMFIGTGAKTDDKIIL
jgi:hypothetical protein